MEGRDVEQLFTHAVDVLVNFKLSEWHLQIVCVCGHEGEGSRKDIFLFSLNLKFNETVSNWSLQLTTVNSNLMSSFSTWTYQVPHEGF